MSFINLLLLPHLPKKKNKDKKSLIDYIQSHVVTSYEYMDILWKKVIEKEIVEEIMEGLHKEREIKQNRKVVDSQTTTK